MVLRHYSIKPLVFDRTRTYPTGEHDFKPTGLWLSVVGDDDWKQWCTAEDFGVDSLVYYTDFAVRSGANVRLIDSNQSMLDFQREFYKGGEFRSYGLDWAHVKSKWGGLIIAPYQWEFRLKHDYLWYYSWDCASGCVWDLNMIEEVGSDIEAGV